MRTKLNQILLKAASGAIAGLFFEAMKELEVDPAPLRLLLKSKSQKRPAGAVPRDAGAKPKKKRKHTKSPRTIEIDDFEVR